MTAPDTTLARAFTQATYYSSGANGRINRVVVHDEEYTVSGHSAEDIAAFFARPDNRSGSAHYVVDADSIEQCVREAQIAYHAPPNEGSIGIEHDGYARFTAADWAKPGSAATLARSAELTAYLCKKYDVPVQWLSAADLLAGKRGITSHANVSAAWHESTHSDPGPGFPAAHYLDMVNAHLVTHDNPWWPHRLIRLLGEQGGPPTFLLSTDSHGLFRQHVPDSAVPDVVARLKAGGYDTTRVDVPAAQKPKVGAIRQEPWS